MKNRSRHVNKQGPFVAVNTGLSRRHFLRGAGILLSLPLLDAMMPAFAAGIANGPVTTAKDARPRRMLAICNNLGLLPHEFFPKGNGGRDYTPSRYLEVLKDYRSDYTVFSGVSHPDVDGGDSPAKCFFFPPHHPVLRGVPETLL